VGSDWEFEKKLG